MYIASKLKLNKMKDSIEKFKQIKNEYYDRYGYFFDECSNSMVYGKLIKYENGYFYFGKFGYQYFVLSADFIGLDKVNIESILENNYIKNKKAKSGFNFC